MTWTFHLYSTMRVQDSRCRAFNCRPSRAVSELCARRTACGCAHGHLSSIRRFCAFKPAARGTPASSTRTYVNVITINGDLDFDTSSLYSTNTPTSFSAIRTPAKCPVVHGRLCRVVQRLQIEGRQEATLGERHGVGPEWARIPWRVLAVQRRSGTSVWLQSSTENRGRWCIYCSSTTSR
jgi:hypothetical protein